MFGKHEDASASHDHPDSATGTQGAAADTSDSGKWHPIPDTTSPTPATCSSGDMQAATPTPCNDQRSANLNTDWIYYSDSE